jgi:hypothetical protein
VLPLILYLPFISKHYFNPLSFSDLKKYVDSEFNCKLDVYVVMRFKSPVVLLNKKHHPRNCK